MDLEEKTCWEKTKLKTVYWWSIFLMPVEYPVSEAYGKGWSDPCNCFCGTLCCIPKTAILILVTPIICCGKVDDSK